MPFQPFPLGLPQVYGPSDASGTRQLALRHPVNDALAAHLRITPRLQRTLDVSAPLTRLLQGAAAASVLAAAAQANAAAASAQAASGAPSAPGDGAWASRAGPEPAVGAAAASVAALAALPTASQMLHWSNSLGQRQVSLC